MAKAAAKSRGRKRGGKAAEEASDGPILVAAGSEIVGLILIGLSLLATLALATYAPEDPIGRLVEVSNRAGPVGATLAGGLLRGFGASAVVFVAACAFLGGRMVMSLGLPDLFSRFWIGAVVMIPTVALLPPLLYELAPGTVPWIEPGWLGRHGADILQLLFGNAGALVLTGLGLSVGVLSLSGVSSGAVLGAAGRGAMWTLDRAMVFGEWVIRGLRRGIDFIHEHPDASWDLYKRFAKQEQSDRLSDRIYQATIGCFCHDLSMSDLYWQRLVDWMVETGQIDAPVDVAPCFDNRLAF